MLGSLRHRLRGHLNLAGSSGHVLDHAADAGLEVVRQLAHGLALLLFGLGLLGLAGRGGTLQLGLAAQLRHLLRALAAQRRRRLLLRELKKAGFHDLQCYARYPSHAQPRYLLRCDHGRAVGFVLDQVPTYTRASRLLRLLLGSIRKRRDLLSAMAPGLSIVGRGGEA